jgi:hypothetical protein
MTKNFTDVDSCSKRISAPELARAGNDFFSEEIQENAYLKSLTPAGEAAVFLSLRGECLREAGRLEEARQCYAGAARFAPEVRLYTILPDKPPAPWPARYFCLCQSHPFPLVPVRVARFPASASPPLPCPKIRIL